MPLQWASVLAVGTTSVETICRRVNTIARPQGVKYLMTIETRLRCFWLQSIMSFRNATIHPTTRQRRPYKYDAAVRSSLRLTDAEWSTILNAPCEHRNTDSLITTFKELKKGGYILKRPAYTLPTKRTPYTLQRDAIRGSVRHRQAGRRPAAAVPANLKKGYSVELFVISLFVFMSIIIQPHE